ncbi:hypothetical protein BC567DRAFT_46390 [Phyllosticta citribraziliensis]
MVAAASKKVDLLHNSPVLSSCLFSQQMLVVVHVRPLRYGDPLLSFPLIISTSWGLFRCPLFIPTSTFSAVEMEICGRMAQSWLSSMVCEIMQASEQANVSAVRSTTAGRPASLRPSTTQTSKQASQAKPHTPSYTMYNNTKQLMGWCVSVNRVRRNHCSTSFGSYCFLAVGSTGAKSSGWSTSFIYLSLRCFFHSISFVSSHHLLSCLQFLGRVGSGWVGFLAHTYYTITHIHALRHACARSHPYEAALGCVAWGGSTGAWFNNTLVLFRFATDALSWLFLL